MRFKFIPTYVLNILSRHTYGKKKQEIADELYLRGVWRKIRRRQAAQ